MGTTANYQIPYPELTDPPDGAGQMKALATKVDTATKTIDTRATDYGNKDAVAVTPAAGWGSITANGRRFGPICVVHFQATRTGAAIAAISTGNIADTQILTITDANFQPHYNTYAGCGVNVGSCGRLFINAQPLSTLFINQYVPNLALNTGDVVQGTLVYIAH